MREIKFRAWDKRQGQMSGAFTITDLTQYEHIFEVKFKHLAQWKDLTWLEYTGLKDKNGKGIFESDIVKTDWGTGKIIYEGDSFNIYLGTARTLPDNTCRNFIEYKDNWQSWEVIGNIYENKELVAQLL